MQCEVLALDTETDAFFEESSTRETRVRLAALLNCLGKGAQMPNAKTTSPAQAAKNSMSRMERDVKDMQHDLVEYAIDYARENPGHAALICMGIGFVLGWKLKPW